MTQEREDYMRRQEAELDMIAMRDPSKSIFAQTSPHPDPRYEMIHDLVEALEDWDNWFCGFDPEDRESRFQGRRIIIRTRELLAKVKS